MFKKLIFQKTGTLCLWSIILFRPRARWNSIFIAFSGSAELSWSKNKKQNMFVSGKNP